MHRHAQLIKFILYTLAVSWLLVFIAGALQAWNWFEVLFGRPEPIIQNEKLSSFLLAGLLGQWMPSLVAIYLVRKAGGKTEMRRFLSRMRPSKAHIKPYLFIILGILMMFLITGIGYVFATSIRPTFPAGHPLLYGLSYLIIIPIGLVFGGLTEEYGWRGYMQPILQRTLHPIIVSVIIALIWTIWHLHPSVAKLLFTDGVGEFLQLVTVDYFYRFLYTLPLTMVFTYAYNKFNGSLFLIILLHASSNAANDTVAPAWNPPIDGVDASLTLAITWGIAAVIILIISKGTLGKPAHIHVVDPT